MGMGHQITGTRSFKGDSTIYYEGKARNRPNYSILKAVVGCNEDIIGEENISWFWGIKRFLWLAHDSWTSNRRKKTNKRKSFFIQVDSVSNGYERNPFFDDPSDQIPNRRRKRATWLWFLKFFLLIFNFILAFFLRSQSNNRIGLHADLINSASSMRNVKPDHHQSTSSLSSLSRLRFGSLSRASNIHSRSGSTMNVSSATSAMNEQEPSASFFFKLVREGDTVIVATTNDSDRQNWVQAIYRATGQTHKPSVPSQATSASTSAGSIGTGGSAAAKPNKGGPSEDIHLVLLVGHV